MKLNHNVAGIAVFAILIGLVVLFFHGDAGVQDVYEVPEEWVVIENTNTSSSVGQRLDDLQILNGFDDLVEAFKSFKISNPLDLLGAIQLFVVGLINTIIGVATFPFEITTIISQTYSFPPIVANGLLTLLIIYLAFALMNIKTGGQG